MTDKPTDQQPTTTPQPPAEPNGANNGGQPDKQELSREVRERIKRAQRSTEEKLLQALGFASLDEAKTAFTEVRQIKDGQKSEAQKALEAQQRAERERDELKTKYEAELAGRLTDRLNGAIKEAIAKAEARNVDDVLILIRAKHADKVAALVGEDGEIDGKAIEKLVADFKSADPSHFKTPGGPGSPSNRIGNGHAPDPKKQKDEPQPGRRLFKL